MLMFFTLSDSGDEVCLLCWFLSCIMNIFRCRCLFYVNDVLIERLVVQQVNGFLEGERNYANLKGDTGPLVYPAGFLYCYSAIKHLTGGEVFPAQVGSLLLHNLFFCWHISNRHVIFDTNMDRIYCTWMSDSIRARNMEMYQGCMPQEKYLICEMLISAWSFP